MLSGFLRDDLLDFHTTFVPSLLAAIRGWAVGAGDLQLSTQAENAATTYADALASLRKARKKRR